MSKKSGKAKTAAADAAENAPTAPVLAAGAAAAAAATAPAQPPSLIETSYEEWIAWALTAHPELSIAEATLRLLDAAQEEFQHIVTGPAYPERVAHLHRLEQINDAIPLETLRAATRLEAKFAATRAKLRAIVDSCRPESRKRDRDDDEDNGRGGDGGGSDPETKSPESKRAKTSESPSTSTPAPASSSSLSKANTAPAPAPSPRTGVTSSCSIVDIVKDAIGLVYNDNDVDITKEVGKGNFDALVELVTKLIAASGFPSCAAACSIVKGEKGMTKSALGLIAPPLKALITGASQTDDLTSILAVLICPAAALINMNKFNLETVKRVIEAANKLDE